MSILPPEVRAGYVVDRVLRAIGDRPYDDDRLPDGIPAQGRVIFRPKTAVKQLVSKGRGVTVTREPVTCTIHQGENQPDDPDASKGGLLIDEAGAVGGVWLVVGEWTAEYHMEDRYSNIPNEEIIVAEEHTEDNPLDVALASEITPTPTQKFVVNEQIYVDSKKARDEALGFRDEAQEAFEQFTWPVHVQDTPPEDTNVIWVNPDEPAGTASDYARRAEEMYEASKALGIRVDNTVGRRVFVGNTMIFGDTGWRDVSNLLLVDTTEAAIYMRRMNDIVYLSADRLRLVSRFSPNTSFFEIPRGFQPTQPFRAGQGATYELNASVYYAADSEVDSRGALRTREEVLEGSRRFYVNWAVIQTWPTSLPGTPA